MANIKSQIKRNRKSEQLRIRNKGVKAELRTRIKNAVGTAGEEQSSESLRLAVQRLDKAAAKGIIHKNQAANRKAGLMKRISSSNS